MAIQHIRAFRARREEFGDQINQDIAHAIADAMGNDDSPATVSIKTLADEARCHYNTADKRTKEMETAGLIKIEKKGRYLTYRIVGEFEPTPYKQPAADNRITEIEKRLDNLERQVEQCVKVIEQLSHDLHTTFTPPSHHLHTNFTPHPNGNVNKEVKKVSSEDVYIPPNPLYELPEEQTPHYDPARDDLIQEMVSAISGEVKETMWDKNKHEFEGAAVALIDKGLKPPDVKGFYTDHWQSNGHYKGKPALKSLLQEIDNYTSQPAVTSWIDDIVLDYREDFEI